MMPDHAPEPIVLDASAAVEMVREDDPRAPARLQRVLAAGAIHVPHSFHAEVANSMRRRFRDDPGYAREVASTIDGYPNVRWDWEVLRDRVWELTANVTPYDAAYVAVAELTGSTLITADARLARAPGLRCRVELW